MVTKQSALRLNWLKMLLVILLCGSFSSSCQIGTTPGGPADGTDNLTEMLGYLPSTWADYHSVDVVDQIIYYLDFERMRLDLEIPLVRGSDPREEKLDLILGLDTQGLSFVPDGLDPLTGSFFAEWGWDIADVDQALYIPEYQWSILKGDFSRPEIATSLLGMGYTESSRDGFSVFQMGVSDLQFALSQEILFISAREVETSPIDLTIPTSFSGTQRLSSHGSVNPLLDHLEGIWGAVLSPSFDSEAYSLEVSNLAEASAEEFLQWLTERAIILGETYAIEWDFFAIAYTPHAANTGIEFLYHYHSEQLAEQDASFVRAILTEGPSLVFQGRTWADLISLEAVSVFGEVLVASATTECADLLGIILEGQDFGFLPVH